jgi:transposase
VAREAALKQELERAQAQIRDLQQRLYGKRSEKNSSTSEIAAVEAKPSRPRGQAPGSSGHGRTPRPHLPVVEEWRALPPESQVCPCCQAPFDPFPGTEDSDIVEIRAPVRAHSQCGESPYGRKP